MVTLVTASRALVSTRNPPFLSPLLEEKSWEAQHRHWAPVGSDRFSPRTKDLEGLGSISTHSTQGDALPPTPVTDPSLST